MKSAAPAHATEREIFRLSWPKRIVILAFVATGFWYLAWRPAALNPQAPVFSAIVYAAELFSFFVALLYLFMVWRLRERVPQPIPAGLSVDVFIPTINESVDLVRRTLLAARRMKQPHETWLLDDGNRPEMKALAAELGCRYLAREENSHAKAGNLNHALAHSSGELIAIFDADHAPAPTFLEETLGFFADPHVAFVQTPQDFYNLDSFQHRSGGASPLVWNEQSLFFRVIQRGKDLFNSAFFCGSCAVIRRTALEDIGGFATGTVTEDIHTSLKLHKRGWRSVYYGKSLAFGLAPANVIPFLKQRLRWGQGAMQVWRKEGIVFARGLSFPQRLSYLATMLAYFEGWQKVVFYVAPVVVLLGGIMPIAALDAEFIMHFLPYYVLTFWAFEEAARGYGRSLQIEQYNMLRFAVFIVATLGFFRRRLKFVVTPKAMGERHAARLAVWPQYLVMGLNLVAVPLGVVLHGMSRDLPTSALVANVLWALVTAGVAGLALRFTGWVASFRRRDYRFPLPVPVSVRVAGGAPIVSVVDDISSSGFRLAGPLARGLGVSQTISGDLFLPGNALPFTATVTGIIRNPKTGEQLGVGCSFEWASAAERDPLDMFLYGSNLQWELNAYRERTVTPLDWLHDRFAGAHAVTGRIQRGWSPVLYRAAANDSIQPEVAFVSPPAEGGGARTLIALRPIADASPLDVNLVTESGSRALSGNITEEPSVSDASGVYCYRFAA